MADGRLREVELDAIRITERRFREQEEERQYQEAKQKAEVGGEEEALEPDTSQSPEEPSVPVVSQKGTKK